MFVYAGRAPIEKGRIEIGPLVSDAVRHLKSALPKQIRINAQLPEEKLAVIGDPTKLSQILVNLITNGSEDFTDEAGGRVEGQVCTQDMAEEDISRLMSLEAMAVVRSMAMPWTRRSRRTLSSLCDYRG